MGHQHVAETIPAIPGVQGVAMTDKVGLPLASCGAEAATVEHGAALAPMLLRLTERCSDMVHAGCVEYAVLHAQRGSLYIEVHTQLPRWVTKNCQARVTVVGERMLTILIHADSPAAQMDWRADFPTLTYEWVETRPKIAQPICAYMKTLGLAYAALDFGIEADTGRYVFYESNSSGQCWLEAHTGAPITTALADLLAEGARL